MEKFNVGGRQVSGTDVSYNTYNEAWNEYMLEDGTTLRLKVIVKRVVRTDAYNPDGTPVYIVQSQNVLDSRVPEILRREGNE